MRPRGPARWLAALLVALALVCGQTQALGGGLLNSHRFGAVTPTGVLADLSTGWSGTAGARDVVDWDAEVYDVTSWHSNSSNNSRATVPAGVTLARATACAEVSSRFGIATLLNGSAYRGRGSNSTETAGQNASCATSALTAVSSGNYLEAEIYSPLNVPNADATTKTWLTAERVDGATKYALVYRSSNQAISAGTTTTINWNAEVADTDAWHDTVTNPSRAAVPAGVSLIRVGGNFAAANSGQLVISFLKNGASARGLPTHDTELIGSESVNAWSPPLEVSSPDYFEQRVFATDAVDIGNDEANWFTIEAVPTTYKRVLLYKTGNQSVSDGVTTTLTFDGEVYDTDAIHDNVTSNSRITTPSGVTEARFYFGVRTGSATSQRVGAVRKNGSGSTEYGLPTAETDTAGADVISAMGAWVITSPGDYYELRFFQSSGGAINVGTDDDTFFAAEFR